MKTVEIAEQCVEIHRPVMKIEFDQLQRQIENLVCRMDTIEKTYTQFGTPHRQNIEKAISQHEAMLSRLRAELAVTPQGG